MKLIQSLNSTLDHEDAGKFALRIAIGGLMLFHGIDKVINPGSLGFIQSLLAGYSLPSVISYGVYLGELIAPLLIIIGFYTRPAALIVAGNMAMVIFLAHISDLFSINKFGGSAIEVQALFLLGAGAIALLGSGKFSVKAD